MARTVGNPLVIAINAVSLALGSYALYYLSVIVVLPPHLAGAGQWQFLTNLSLLYTLFVFLVGLVAHVTKSPALFRLKNNLHPIALALESVVTLVYWPLRLMFVHILVKDPTAKFIPIFIDLCLHAMPAAALLVDFFVFMPKWTLSPQKSFAACVVISLVYWVWLKYLIDFQNGGEYPYMFLNFGGDATRLLIFVAVGLLGWVSFMVLRMLYDLVVAAEKVRKED